MAIDSSAVNEAASLVLETGSVADAVDKMNVSMKRSAIQVNDRLVDLISGMTVSAGIKTGKRRLIEYVMAPLMRYRQESVRER